MPPTLLSSKLARRPIDVSRYLEGHHVLSGGGGKQTSFPIIEFIFPLAASSSATLGANKKTGKRDIPSFPALFNVTFCCPQGDL